MSSTLKTAALALLMSSANAFSTAFTSHPTSRATAASASPSASSFIRDHANAHAHAQSTSTSTSLHMSTRNSNDTDYYRVLGISRSADKKEIKSAYRKMAKQYHPDANPGKDTTERFQEINRAYEVLNNPDLKQKYDMYGAAGVGTSAASDQQAGSPFGGPGGGFGQEVDLGDIFDSFFGGDRKSTRLNSSHRT